MQLLPSRQNSQYQMQLNLSGTNFILDFEWNALNEYWVLGIYDSSEVAIVTGLKIVNNWDLFEGIVATGMPEGNLLCQSIIQSWENLTRYALGNQSALVYYEENEIETLQLAGSI